jgi:hypothetical protein
MTLTCGSAAIAGSAVVEFTTALIFGAPPLRRSSTTTISVAPRAAIAFATASGSASRKSTHVIQSPFMARRFSVVNVRWPMPGTILNGG